MFHKSPDYYYLGNCFFITGSLDIEAYSVKEDPKQDDDLKVLIP